MQPEGLPGAITQPSWFLTSTPRPSRDELARISLGLEPIVLNTIGGFPTTVGALPADADQGLG